MPEEYKSAMSTVSTVNEMEYSTESIGSTFTDTAHLSQLFKLTNLYPALTHPFVSRTVCGRLLQLPEISIETFATKSRGRLEASTSGWDATFVTFY